MDTTNNKIMIIDDDEDSTNLFKIFLEFHGYEIHAYTDSIEAFHSFKKDSHDLIILDLHMPKMDGITLYKKMRHIDDNVIICLTSADINYIEELCKNIIDIKKFVIYKPVSLKDLKTKVDSLLLYKHK